jgi:hypothetical protein
VDDWGDSHFTTSSEVECEGEEMHTDEASAIDVSDIARAR